LPQFFIGSFSEVLEIPIGAHSLGRGNSDAIGSDSGELHLIDGVAIAFIEHSEAPVQDFPALLFGAVGVPMVGDECESVVLGKAGGSVVLGDVVAVEVDGGEVRLSVFKASDNEVVVVWVLVVPLFVGELGEVVGVVRHRVLHIVIEEEGFVLQLSQFSRRLLEIRVFSGGCDEHVFCDLLVPVDAGVFCVFWVVLRRPP